MKNKWAGVLDIPEGQVGDYKIRHIKYPPNTTLETANMRCQYIGGQKNHILHFDDATTWHELSYEGGVWMTDLPCEQAQHDSELGKLMDVVVHGATVLVGGLGLGYAVTQLCQHEKVEFVVCVEKSAEVIALVKPHLNIPDTKLAIINQDLFDYLANIHVGPTDLMEPFDCAFYDIWQADNENTFFNVVCKLRELSEHIVLDEYVVCWNEDVMRGQLMFKMLGALNKPDTELIERLSTPIPETESHHIYYNWMNPFFQAIKNGQLSFPDAQKIAGDYVRMWGREAFDDWWMDQL